MSPAARPSAAARTSAEGGAPTSAGSAGRSKEAWPCAAAGVTRHGTSPIFASSDTARAFDPPSKRASSTAVPTIGCPAKGSSRLGVKMRMQARCAASRGGSTNTVSDRLNSRAIACMASSASPSASSTTASGLPANGRSVKTSRVTKRRFMMKSNAAMIRSTMSDRQPLASTRSMKLCDATKQRFKSLPPRTSCSARRFPAARRPAEFPAHPVPRSWRARRKWPNLRATAPRRSFPRADSGRKTARQWRRPPRSPAAAASACAGGSGRFHRRPAGRSRRPACRRHAAR